MLLAAQDESVNPHVPLLQLSNVSFVSPHRSCSVESSSVLFCHHGARSTMSGIIGPVGPQADLPI